MVILKENAEGKISLAWICSKWVSFKFFEDVLASSEVNTDLTKKIEYLNDCGLDTISLLHFPNDLEEFKKLIDNAIEYNKKQQGADMHDPSYFQVYFDKLLELKEMFKEVYNVVDEEE